MKIINFVAFLIFFIDICCANHYGKVTESLASDDESRLRDYLFKYKGYNHLIRPVVNLTNVVNVQLELALNQIINVEEKKQILKSNVWIRMIWKDYQLTWEPADFGGITVTRVRANTVWKPDIVLLNNADGNYEVLWQPNILVEYNGNILWIPPAIYVSSCNILVQYFPFDEQNCEIRFGSWTYNARQISLNFIEGSKIDLSTYWKSGTWDIISCQGRVVNGTTDSSGIETPMIIYELQIRRKTLFYTVILVLPCLLISLLTVTVFYLPADDHHKMTLCISILLALIVFFLLISKLLPPTSKSIPLISKFLLFTFIINIIVIVLTVVIINLNYRTPRTHYMSPWVRMIFIQYLPILLGMNRPKHIEKELLDKKKVLKSRADHTLNSNYFTTKTFQNLRSNSRRIIKIIDSQISMELLSKNQQTVRDSYHLPSTSYSNKDAHVNDCLDEDDDGYHDDLIGPSSSSVHGNHHHSYLHANNSPHTHTTFSRANHNQIICSDDTGGDSSGDGDGSSTRSTYDSKSYFKGFEISEDVRDAMCSINFISAHTELQDEFTKGKLEWQFVASVIDRLMLLIFTTVSIIGSATLFLRTPYFFSLFDANSAATYC